MTMANYQPLRGRCMHCHSPRIRPLSDGWICPQCGQTGVPPVCEAAGCLLRWNGIPDGDCRAPGNVACYQKECDQDLYQ